MERRKLGLLPQQGFISKNSKPSAGNFQITCNERFLKIYLIAIFLRQNKVRDRRKSK